MIAFALSHASLLCDITCTKNWCIVEGTETGFLNWNSHFDLKKSLFISGWLKDEITDTQ